MMNQRELLLSTQPPLEEQPHVLPSIDRLFLVDHHDKFSPQLHLHVLEEEMYHLANF